MSCTEAKPIGNHSKRGRGRPSKRDAANRIAGVRLSKMVLAGEYRPHNIMNEA
jgi:hypothetical protein